MACPWLLNSLDRKERLVIPGRLSLAISRNETFKMVHGRRRRTIVALTKRPAKLFLREHVAADVLRFGDSIRIEKDGVPWAHVDRCFLERLVGIDPQGTAADGVQTKN